MGAWRRNKSSSAEQNILALPGSPCRAARPKSWRSTRPEPCGSVEITCRPPELGDAAGELDVGAAAGHVRRDGDLPGLPGLGDDRRFLGFCAALSTRCIRPCRSAAGSPPRLASTLRVPTSTGTPLSLSSQTRSTTASHFSSSCRTSGSEVACGCRGLLVGIRTTGALINLPQLRRRFPGGAGHAAHDRILPEKSLKAEAGEVFLVGSDRDVFLHFDRLVQAMPPGAVGHDAAGEFVDDLHLPSSPTRYCSSRTKQCRAVSAWVTSSSRRRLPFQKFAPCAERLRADPGRGR